MRREGDDFHFDLTSATYTPGRFLDVVAELLRCRNDFALAAELEVSSSLVSKVRHRKLPMTARMMVRIMDRTGWHITKLRRLVGMPAQ